jgi:hypothetical protein
VVVLPLFEPVVEVDECVVSVVLPLASVDL